MPAIAVPIVLAWALVLSDFGTLAVPLSYLPRPLLVATVVAVAVVATVSAGLRRHPTSLRLVVATLGCGLLLRPFSALLAFVGITAAIGVVHQWRKIRRQPRVPLTAGGLGRAVSIVSSALLVVAASQAILVAQWPSQLPPRSQAGPASVGPNFYVVLLDGYPRDDTLRTTFGHDNSVFLQALERRGFDIYREAKSEHTNTVRTLAAVFGHETSDAEGVSALRQWKRLTARPDAVEPFRQEGYAFVTIVQPVGQATADGADLVIDTGQVNDFEAHLLAGSAMALIARDWTLDRLMDEQRERLVQSLDRLRELSGGSGKRLVLAHFMAPHGPFMWREGGASAPGPACWPSCHLWSSTLEQLDIPLAAYVAAMRGQLAVLNHLLLDAIDDVLAHDPGVVIVLFGDHGTRYDLEADPEEGYRVFLAARTPGHADLYARDPRVATILSALDTAYLR